MKTTTPQKLEKRIKRQILFFIVCLCLSGITAFPLLSEISWLHDKILPIAPPFVQFWINRVFEGIKTVNSSYPYIAYGTDWLAFAHIVIAIAFLGPYCEPVKNIWVIQFGRIACFLVFPVAFICGGIRGIPFWWQLIDCSFGAIGLIVLTSIYRDIQKLELLTITNNKLISTL